MPQPRDLFDAHFRKLRVRGKVSAAQEQAIRGILSDPRHIPAQKTLVRENEQLSESILILDGWVGRTKDDSKGNRQVLELHVAGDFADMHGFTLKHLDHNVIALSPSIIATALHTNIERLFQQHPELARMYWFSTNVDAAIQREWTFSLGRRAAEARMANFFCEMFLRLDLAGRVESESFHLPLSQAQLGECVGLTTVHINRTLQILRRKGLVQLEGKRLTILNARELRKVAEFDPTYLYLNGPQPDPKRSGN
jgi:cAMP-binding proteins - catabolite gene activator and regulatory subunit of cAMP-dependent protein kinases